jgi:predicted nucleic acid-binding protein
MSHTTYSTGRMLMKLGEAGTVDMRVSREVLGDCERVLRKIDPTQLNELAVGIHMANIATTLDPHSETVARCMEMTGYRPDARVLATAIECDADLFITYDSEHFLRNPLIGPPDTKLRVVTPHQAFEWVQNHLRPSAED